MEFKDIVAVAMAEARTRYAETLAKASEESDTPLFVKIGDNIYLQEALLGVVMANVVTLQEALNVYGMSNVANAMNMLVILMDEIHDAGHLTAVDHG